MNYTEEALLNTVLTLTIITCKCGKKLVNPIDKEFYLLQGYCLSCDHNENLDVQ